MQAVLVSEGKRGRGDQGPHFGEQEVEAERSREGEVAQHGDGDLGGGQVVHRWEEPARCQVMIEPEGLVQRRTYQFMHCR